MMGQRLTPFILAKISTGVRGACPPRLTSRATFSVRNAFFYPDGG